MSDLRMTSRPTTATITAVGLILGLLAQSAGIVWWGAHIDQRVTSVEQKVAASAPLSEVVARMDERDQALVTTVNRIEARIAARDDALEARRP